jgi:carboxymethylenebutenolidase
MLRDDLRTEFDALLPGRSTDAGATRRTALKTALGVGYAATTLPIMAQTAVKTSCDRLNAGPVTIDVGGFKMPAYRSAPDGQKNLPIIIVIQEVFGVHEYIADITRRFARAGYLAVAPELYARQGDPRKYTEVGKLISELVSKVPDGQVLSDLDATVAWAQANGGNKKVGVTGFCWGGRITWLYAAHNPQVKAAVSWYGRLVGQPSSLTPNQPVNVAGTLNAPVLGLYGGQDSGIPLTSVNEMKEALATGSKAAKKSQFVVYPDAPHAFHADYRPSFRKDAAEDGWKRALAWFKQNGVA